jgi:hypothetical protein
VVLVAEVTTTSLEAAAKPARVLTAVVVFKEVWATSGPVVEAVVPVQLAPVQDPRAGVHLVVQVVLESPTALLDLHRVTPAVAQVGTKPQLQTWARFKEENVAPPWWVEQVPSALAQRQVR